MAGSYGHVNFIDGSWDTVEHLGDAYETVEQLLWLVGYLGTIRYTVDGQVPSLEKVHERIERLLDRVYFPLRRGELEEGISEGLPAKIEKAVQRVMNNELPYPAGKKS